MKGVKILLVSIVSLFLMEGTIRLSGIYQTYAEANFNRYEEAYGQTWSIDYFKQRSDSIIYKQNEFEFACPCNTLGFRDTKAFNTPSKDKFRVLFLGDSFTEGVGASCGNTMPEVFQRLHEDSIEVFNGGVVGSDPFFYLEWHEKYFAQLEVDQVFIILNNSDISDYIFRGGDERFNLEEQTAQFKDPPWQAKLYRFSHLFRFILHFILNYDFTLLSHSQFEKQSNKAIVSIGERINAWQATFPNIALHVVVHPYTFASVKQVPGHDKVPLILDELDEGIKRINLYPAMSEKINATNYLEYSWRYDGHFNDAGYTLFAEELLKATMDY